MIEAEKLSTLLQNLADSDPSVRRMSAETLCEADERAIYPLIKSLRDHNVGVQDAAMRSLIAIGGEVTAYMALPLLRDDPCIRNTARIILRQIGQPAVQLLRSCLADKDDDIRTFAVDLIADIGYCAYPEDVVRLLEADPNQNVRASAARAIGALEYRPGLPALAAALRDNEWVCFSALESLGLLKDESSVNPILSLLGNPSETLRYAAIETLGKIGSPQSSGPLVARLTKAGNFEKNAIIRSLVQIGMTPAMTEIADLLIEMFSHGEWEESLVSLTGLADLKHGPAIPVILDAAGALDPSDPAQEDRLLAMKQALLKFGCNADLIAVLADPAVKFRSKVIAAEVVGALRCTEAVQSLITLLSGDLREVRRAAILALGNIGGDDALKMLRMCINDRDGHVRNAAIIELGRSGDRASFDALLNHLGIESYRDVFEETVKALLKIDSKSFIPRLGSLAPVVREIVARNLTDTDALLALSREADVPTRVAALSSLGNNGDDRVHKRLSEALSDENPEVRKTAVIALGSLNNSTGELIKALEDKDMWVRLYAVKALGESRNPNVAASITHLLSDAEVPVVLSAIDALVQLDNSDRTTISALRNHHDERVRERVIQVMEHVC